jgi:hypothetical protein
VRTGQQVTAGRATVEAPGGREATISGVKTNSGAVVKGPNDTYAAHDGSVYRRDQNGGWQKHTDNGWQPVNLGGSAGPAADQQRRLDADHQARAKGEARFGGYRGGSFRTAAPHRAGGRR